MNILMLGDVVGKPGYTAVLERVQDLKDQHQIDFTVLNAENVAGRFFLHAPIGLRLFYSAVHVIAPANPLKRSARWAVSGMGGFKKLWVGTHTSSLGMSGYCLRDPPILQTWA